MIAEDTPDRTVLRLTGADRHAFLQGLVTNDLKSLDTGLVYTALLSPQGKYLADFFLAAEPEAILLDVKSSMAEALVRRLALYRLRADVAITATRLHVQRGLGPPPPGGFADPRDPALGWRRFAKEGGGAPDIDWDAIRVAHTIPESGIELIADETYILEAGFERLNGVDFRKGCYVGQEVTARMKHKTELRKGLVAVVVDGVAQVGAEVLSDGKPAGVIYTQSDGRAIAYLRHDRIAPEMQAGNAVVRPLPI